MATTGSRSGAAEKLALPLMVLAFIAVGGFLYWLGRTAEPTTVTVQEEMEEDTEGVGPLVTMDELAANAAAFVGQSIRLSGVEVTSRLGTQAFWTTLPNQTPYLIRIGPELSASGFAVLSGDRAELVLGTVHEMSDSVLNAWVAEGILTSDIQRIEAEFATSFLEADMVQLASPGGQGAGGEAR